MGQNLYDKRHSCSEMFNVRPSTALILPTIPIQHSLEFA